MFQRFFNIHFSPGALSAFLPDALLFPLLRRPLVAQWTVRTCINIKSFIWMSSLIVVNPFLLSGNKFGRVRDFLKDNPLKCLSAILIPGSLKVAIFVNAVFQYEKVPLPALCNLHSASNVDTGCREMDDSVDASNFPAGK